MTDGKSTPIVPSAF